jgi:cytochrome P450
MLHSDRDVAALARFDARAALVRVAMGVLQAVLRGHPSLSQGLTMTSQRLNDRDSDTRVPERPTGLELTPFDQSFRDNPYPILNQLREVEPVHFDQRFERWFLADFASVRQILRDKGVSKDSSNADPDSFLGRFAANAQTAGVGSPIGSMLFMDDPEHRRLRNLVAKPFSIKAVEELRPGIRAIAEGLVDQITPSRFDLIETLAAPLPLIVIANMLGVEPGRRDEFKRWTDAIVAGFFNPLQDAGKNDAAALAQREFNDYFLQVIAERRRDARTDLISDMVNARDAGAPMSDDEILAQCSLLLTAGNITTTDLIGNGVKVLLDHPEQLAVLRAQPELFPNAIEEILRYESPVIQASRTFVDDMSVSGCPVHAGQSASVSLAAANRDPRLNKDPSRFDIRRTDPRHVSFGGGVHLCLGAWLARAEAQEAIGALLRRFPVLEMLPQDLRYKTIPAFRGLETLWLRDASAKEAAT